MPMMIIRIACLPAYLLLLSLSTHDPIRCDPIIFVFVLNVSYSLWLIVCVCVCFKRATKKNCMSRCVYGRVWKWTYMCMPYVLKICFDWKVIFNTLNDTKLCVFLFFVKLFLERNAFYCLFPQVISVVLCFFSIVVISSKQNYTNTNVRNEKCWYFANYGPVFVVFSRDDYICFVLFATQTMTESILPWN